MIENLCDHILKHPKITDEISGYIPSEKLNVKRFATNNI